MAATITVPLDQSQELSGLLLMSTKAAVTLKRSENKYPSRNEHKEKLVTSELPPRTRRTVQVLKEQKQTAEETITTTSTCSRLQQRRHQTTGQFVQTVAPKLFLPCAFICEIYNRQSGCNLHPRCIQTETGAAERLRLQPLCLCSWSCRATNTPSHAALIHTLPNRGILTQGNKKTPDYFFLTGR